MEKILLEKIYKRTSPTEIYVEWRPLNEEIKNVAYYGNSFNSKEESDLYDDIAAVEIANAINGYFGDTIYVADVPVTLEEHKQRAKSIVDELTKSEIYKGFEFDGNRFSMSIEAQINWSNILMVPDSYFPIMISTTSGAIYNLTLSNKQAFYGASLLYKTSLLSLGNTRKETINNSQSVDEIKQLINIYKSNNA